jgi:hypothetical protein
MQANGMAIFADGDPHDPPRRVDGSKGDDGCVPAAASFFRRLRFSVRSIHAASDWNVQSVPIAAIAGLAFPGAAEIPRAE